MSITIHGNRIGGLGSMHDSTSPRIAEFGNIDPVSPLKVAFISDLHLLSSRHDYARHADAVRGAVERCDVCIWGGDLFDFHWSCEGDGAASHEIAIEWLQAWRKEFPQKCYVYLTGNHDASPAFQCDLTRWAGGSTTQRRLVVEPGAAFTGLDGLRIGDALFVHGDGIESLPKMVGSQKSLTLYRSRWQPEWVSHDLKRIVFGHTHRRLDAYAVSGTRFYNGGAAVRHVAFAPIELTVELHSSSGRRKFSRSS